ncbi:MAG: SsrA-binding protein SmpB [Thermoleophilia bacterium]
MAKSSDEHLVASNRKAYHDFFIEETYEAGIALVGTEVKSLRAGKANLRDSYAEIRNGQLYLVGVHISPYEQGNLANHDPLRRRQLLLHKGELDRIATKVREKGYTIVPTRIYFKGSLAKIEIGLARGKRQYDKRADLAKKDAQRDVERVLRARQRADH